MVRVMKVRFYLLDLLLVCRLGKTKVYKPGNIETTWWSSCVCQDISSPSLEIAPILVGAPSFTSIALTCLHVLFSSDHRKDSLRSLLYYSILEYGKGSIHYLWLLQRSVDHNKGSLH